MGPIPTLKSDA